MPEPLHPAVLAELSSYLEDPCEALGGAGTKPCPLEYDPCTCRHCTSGREAGPCNCEHCQTAELWRIAKCKHILAMERTGATCLIQPDQAAVLLTQLDGDAYREPKPAPLSPQALRREPPGEYRFPKEAELDLFDARAAILEADDPPIHALRRDDDILVLKLDEVSEQGELGKSTSGLTTWSAMAERERQERREAEYRSPLDLLAERAQANLGARGREIQRARDKATRDYLRNCDARSYERWQRPRRSTRQIYDFVMSRNVLDRCAIAARSEYQTKQPAPRLRRAA